MKKIFNHYRSITTRSQINKRNFIFVFMLENQNSPLSHYSLVMEYADSGTLQSYLKENNLSWNDKFNIAYQLACAVTCLHNEGIVHNDLVTCFLIVMLLYTIVVYVHAFTCL